MYNDIAFKKIFNKKKILITGGTGSIGGEIAKKLLLMNPKQIRIYSRDETKQYNFEKELEELKTKIDIKLLIGDIRDKDRLSLAFRDIDIVFHAAALKHVPFCEYNPFEAVKTNVYGTQNIIDLAIQHNVEKVIAISTDKAVYPNTILGITKLLMERLIISSKLYTGASKTKFCVVRFGNVVNSRGSVRPLWINQINNNKPITLTDIRMKRYFMEISEAVSLVFAAASCMKGQEIFVLKMQEKKLIDLANDVITDYSNGRKVKINITGIRSREKLQELLFTNEENEIMVETKRFYVILPNIYSLKSSKRYYRNNKFLN